MKKICTKCHTEKDLSEFPKDASRPSGIFPWCKKCNLENVSTYKKAHPDKVRRSALKSNRKRRMRPEVRERDRQHQKQYRLQPKVKTQNAAYAKEYNQRPEVKRANNERKKKYNRDPAVRQYRAMVQRRRHLKQLDAPGRHTLIDWRILCKLSDSCCLRCGEVADLTVDHIIPISADGCDCIENVQPLCQSCNSSKGAWHTTDYRTPAILEWLCARNSDEPRCNHR